MVIHMISIEGLSYAYPNAGDREALHDIDFQLNRGEYFQLFGEDDSGKTTLLHVILGYLTRYTGICTTDFASVRYIPDGIYIERNRKVKEYLGWQNHYGKTYSVEMQDELMEIFGIGSETEMLQMTYEQNKLVTLIGAIASMPELFVADEITNYLSKDSWRKVKRALKILNKKGTTVFLTGEHYADYADYASSFAYMRNGQLVKQGKVKRERTGGRVVSIAGYGRILSEKAGFQFLCERQNVQFYLYQGPMAPLCQTLAGISCTGITIEELTWEEEFLKDYARWE